jgi:hypothetical protein
VLLRRGVADGAASKFARRGGNDHRFASGQLDSLAFFALVITLLVTAGVSSRAVRGGEGPWWGEVDRLGCSRLPTWASPARVRGAGAAQWRCRRQSPGSRRFLVCGRPLSSASRGWIPRRPSVPFRWCRRWPS